MDRKNAHTISSYTSSDEIEHLVARFLDCSLPCAEWTHGAHLTVGLWHAREHSPDEALARVRSGIQRYNAACGTPNNQQRGYHETLTCFYMHMIGRYLVSVIDRSDWSAVTNDLIDQYGSRDLPLLYYSRERLMSSQARAGWVTPDLRPLP